MDDRSSSDQKLQSILQSFLAAKDEIDEESIRQLTAFINTQHIGEHSVETIRHQVNNLQRQEQQTIHHRQDLASLFTPDQMVRRIRFGSPFCPNCQMFKNYDKECPYCQYLEMTY